MEKRLIPYSVHLPEDIYKQLKAAAGERKASALVRDAITLIVSGDDEFNGGYNKGIMDCIGIIHQNRLMSSLSYDGVSLADLVGAELEAHVVHQNTKGKKNGKKKT